MLEHLPAGCLILDGTDVITYANVTFAKWLDTDREALVGRRFAELLSMGGKLFYTNLHTFREGLQGEVEELNYDLRRSDGTYLPVAVATRLLPNGDRAYLVTRTTVRRLFEAQLREAKRVAERATEAKSRFLATMTHELRTPVHAMIGASEILGEGRLSDEDAEALRLLNNASTHLLQLVNDILDLSKAEATELAIAPEPTDLHALCQTTLDSLRSVIRADRELTLSLDDTRLPHGYYSFDASKLRRVLTNLIGNAIKFTPAGSVTLSVAPAEAKAVEPGGLAIRFAVSDTGAGIAPQRLEAIFEPFVQEAGVLTAGEGTGLGLSISRHLVEAMGGRIAATSAVGEGSTFEFTLQTSPAPAPAAVPATAEIDLSGLRVLIADDNATNRFIANRQLVQLGITVTQAMDGLDAVRHAERADFDAILMDLRMPVMDGIEAATKIKQIARHATTPIVVVSAGSFSHLAEGIQHSAFAGALPKPFAAWQLRSVIADVTLAGRSAQSPRAPMSETAPAEPHRPRGAAAQTPAPLDDSPALPPVTFDLSLVDADFGDPGDDAFRKEFLEVIRTDLAGSREGLVAAVAAGDVATVRGERHRLSTVLRYLRPEPLRQLIDDFIAEPETYANPQAARKLDLVFRASVEALDRQLESE